MPTKVVNIRMEEDLLKYLQNRADKEHRTLSNMIISILLTEKENDCKAEVEHWIDIIINEDMSGVRCSKCGYEYSGIGSNFCPNCGARMVKPTEE